MCVGTVAETGAWADWVSSELDDLLDVGSCALESCEVSVDLMETIGMTVLLARGQAAHSRVEHALNLLSAAAEAWQDAQDAVAAIDPAGPAGPVGAVGPAGQGALAGTVGTTGPVEGTGHGTEAGATGQVQDTTLTAPAPAAAVGGPVAGTGTAGGTDPAGAADQAGALSGSAFAGQASGGTSTEGPADGSTPPPGTPSAGMIAAVDGPGAAPSEQAQHTGLRTGSGTTSVSDTHPAGHDTAGTGTADQDTPDPSTTGPGAAALGAAVPAGVSGPGAGSRWDRVRDRVPFHGAPVHGTLREWGFTERAWKKTSGDSCELSLTPDAGHVPYSDPVNDVFWVTATDDHGNTVEAHPLYSTRDRLAGPEHNTEPGARQAIRELVEDKGLPKALSAGAKYAAASGMTAAAGVIAADGGHTAATAMTSGSGPVVGGVGLTATWATHAIIAKRRGKIRDPSAPRTVRFNRPLDQMKNLHLHVQRGDHARHDRETARAHTLTLLDHHAQQHQIDPAIVKRSRRDIEKLPRFPRGAKDDIPPDRCQQAALMHFAEGRERLVREFLGIDDTSGKG
ncbi:MAG: hypothetical protein QG608_1674 [Actinomycetota bacterium]|nr:hypothetical protein [Actinomycetota bacterium]